MNKARTGGSVFKSVEGRRLIQREYRKILTGWPSPNRHLRITTGTGEQFWVFHGAVDGQWYLHGMFV